MVIDVDVVADEGVVAPLDVDAIAAVADVVLMAEGVTRPCAVSVSIVSETRMREINRAWRGVDAATDVVSLECERPDDADLAAGEPCELGDIVLAPAYIARQARRLTTTEEAEFTLMLIHGMLHLLGYDHLTDVEAQAMEAREDELLARVLGRSLPHVVTTRHRAHTDGGAAA